MTETWMFGNGSRTRLTADPTQVGTITDAWPVDGAIFRNDEQVMVEVTWDDGTVALVDLALLEAAPNRTD